VRRLVWMVAGGLLVLACARPDAGETGDAASGTGSGDGLVHSLEVGVDADTVRFTLYLTNATDQAVVLQFPTAQRYDFEVRSPGGDRVWRWSDGQFFAQMLGEETLAAGESVSYEASWSASGQSGAHEAIGRVTSSSTPIELRTEFEIPVR